MGSQYKLSANMDAIYLFFYCFLSVKSVSCIDCYVCKDSCPSLKKETCEQESLSCMTTTELNDNITIVTQRSCWTSQTATCTTGTRGEQVCSCLTSLCNLHSQEAALRNSSKHSRPQYLYLLLHTLWVC